MSNPNRNSRIGQVIITAVGALIGGFFGDQFFVPPDFFYRPPTSSDVAWAICGVSVSVVVGAALFSWAGKCDRRSQ